MEGNYSWMGVRYMRKEERGSRWSSRNVKQQHGCTQLLCTTADEGTASHAQASCGS